MNDYMIQNLNSNVLMSLNLGIMKNKDILSEKLIKFEKENSMRKK